MALIKWTGQDVLEPFRDFGDLETERHRLFGRPLFPSTWLAPKSGGQWLPEVDVTEEKDRLIVKADLPGMKQEEIAVEVSDGVLTMKGERKRESETRDAKTYRVERSYGGFLRSLTLPAGVDATKAHAAYKSGVLEIALPKLAEAKAKQIKVEVR